MEDRDSVFVPKDLSKIKTKFLFGLTRRQCLFFGLGAAVGLPVFFLLRKSVSSTAASMLMMGVMLPFFMFGIYEKNGQPLENVLRQSSNADAVDLLPGTMPRVLERLKPQIRQPIIASGLLSDKQDVVAALSAGAQAVSTTKPELWEI